MSEGLIRMEENTFSNSSGLAGAHSQILLVRYSGVFRSPVVRLSRIQSTAHVILIMHLPQDTESFLYERCYGRTVNRFSR